jgi:hypothetical protein
MFLTFISIPSFSVSLSVVSVSDHVAVQFFRIAVHHFHGLYITDQSDNYGVDRVPEAEKFGVFTDFVEIAVGAEPVDRKGNYFEK